MTGIVNALWNALRDTVNHYQEDDEYISFDDEKFLDFKKSFEDLYNNIKDKYMKHNVKTLDRHKVAAVMIVSSLQSNAVSYTKKIGSRHFFGEEMFSTEVALNWMLDALNERLTELGQKRIEVYHMPKAFACDTPYFDIFCRNLYYAEQHYKLNPLDIAEKLYLLEYITLLQNGIDPSKLCE